MSRKLVQVAVVFVMSLPAWTQELERVPAELVGFPEMILVNGKIIAVDDHSFTSRLGTIAQAMAIRDGKVLAGGMVKLSPCPTAPCNRSSALVRTVNVAATIGTFLGFSVSGAEPPLPVEWK